MMHRTSATVAEVGTGTVRLRVGAPGHQHRILFSIPKGEEGPFNRAALAGNEVNVWIEVPDSDLDTGHARAIRVAAEAVRLAHEHIERAHKALDVSGVPRISSDAAGEVVFDLQTRIEMLADRVAPQWGSR
jgi:hypothetical protein